MSAVQPCLCARSSHDASKSMVVLSACVSALGLTLWVIALGSFAWPHLQELRRLRDRGVFFQFLQTLRKEPMEARAMEIFRARTHERYRSFAKLVAKYVAPVVVGIVSYSSIKCLEFGGNYPLVVYITDLASVVLAVLYTLITLVDTRIQLPRALFDAMNALAFLVFSAMPLVADTQKFFEESTRAAQIAGLCLSLCILDSRQIVLLNLLSYISQVSMAVFKISDQYDQTSHLVFATVSTALNCVVSFSTRWNHLTEAEALHRERQASRSEEVVQSLLSVVCDAVVALRPDLTVRESSQRLASLLLRPDLARPACHETIFTRYVAPDHVEKFLEFLRPNDSGHEPARSIRIHLLDSLGTRVKVQLFHTQMLDNDDNLNHLLGIVEEGPDEEVPGPVGKSASAHSDAGSDGRSSLASWGRQGDAVLLVRTRFTWEIVAESDVSKSFFAFGRNPDPQSFLERFTKPRVLAKWLESNYALACKGILEHDKLEFGAVSFFNPSVGSSYEGRLKAKIVRVPEEQPTFRLENETVDMELRISAPKLQRRPTSKHQGLTVRTLGPGPLAMAMALSESRQVAMQRGVSQGDSRLQL